jgi:hypothetical protein
MMTQKPKYDKEIKAEVKGYACYDDCWEYVSKVSYDDGDCGWQWTSKTLPIW